MSKQDISNWDWWPKDLGRVGGQVLDDGRSIGFLFDAEFKQWLENRKEVLAKCPKCDGCGKIADSEDGEPWTIWTDLPLKSSAAVLMGLVKPINCPECGGSGNA